LGRDIGIDSCQPERIKSAKVLGMENFLYFKLQKGEAISYVETPLKDSDLELPFEVFAERYVRPAYDQLIIEMKHQLDKTGMTSK
jgi:hypothetical protein